MQKRPTLDTISETGFSNGVMRFPNRLFGLSSFDCLNNEVLSQYS